MQQTPHDAILLTETESRVWQSCAARKYPLQRTLLLLALALLALAGLHCHRHAPTSCLARQHRGRPHLTEALPRPRACLRAHSCVAVPQRHFKVQMQFAVACRPKASTATFALVVMASRRYVGPEHRPRSLTAF